MSRRPTRSSCQRAGCPKAIRDGGASPELESTRELGLLEKWQLDRRLPIAGIGGQFAEEPVPEMDQRRKKRGSFGASGGSIETEDEHVGRQPSVGPSDAEADAANVRLGEGNV